MSSPTFEFLNRDEIVRAGAGAGKTYSLTHRVMDVAELFREQNGRPPRMIVTTFTRKATQELRERLMRLALTEKPHLLSYVTSRSNLLVSTLHGVMESFLRRHGAAVGLEPGFKILDEPKARRMARVVLRQTLTDADSNCRAAGQTLLETFSFLQLLDFCRRIEHWRIEHGSLKPFSSDDFAAILRARLYPLRQSLRSVVSQIHVESSDEKWSLIAQIFSAISVEVEKDTVSNAQFISQRARLLELQSELPQIRRPSRGVGKVSLSLIENAKLCVQELAAVLGTASDPEFWQISESIGRKLDELSRRFGERLQVEKKRLGAVELEDLELLAWQVMGLDPGGVRVFANEWDYWLIDEYQDTSPLQVEILKKVVADRASFIVGDPQQSIYLFRGARSEVFQKREDQVAQSGGACQTLSINRRSSPELLQFINQIFTSMRTPFLSMQPFFGERIGYDRDRVAATIACFGEDTAAPDTEVLAIVSHIQRLLQQGSRLDDIAVLARTKKTLLEVAEALNRFGLASYVHGGAGFYDRREIVDALALLKFLAHPWDPGNVIELLRSPWFHVAEDEIAGAASERGQNLWVTLQKKLGAHESIRRLQAALDVAQTVGLTESLRRALLDAGFFDFVHIHDVTGQREANLWKLIQRLSEGERLAGFNILDFVRSVRGQMEESPDEDDAVAAVEPDRINLMTVHAAKGLEFRHVLIPRLADEPRLTRTEVLSFAEDEGKFSVRIPFGEEGKSSLTLGAEAWLHRFQKLEKAEHLRVFYVAATRAVETLYFSWTGEPQSGSWASDLQIDLAEGLHQSEFFRYQVLRDPSSSLAEMQSVRYHSEPRHPWIRREENQAFGSTSVTELVRAKMPLATNQNRSRGFRDILESMQVGTRVHRIFELLKYPMPKDRLQNLLTLWFPDRIDEVVGAVHFVLECQKPPLAQLIRDGSVEWGFTMLDEGRKIEGQVDLWGRAEDGHLWIVDYKTGGTDFMEMAFAQMEIYARALRAAGEQGPISLAAVYPFTKKVAVHELS